MWEFLLGLDLEVQRARTLRVPLAAIVGDALIGIPVSVQDRPE
jgi:hypothetical protein